MKTKIYGITDDDGYGNTMAKAIHSETGDIIAQHTSSGGHMARLDLGFSEKITHMGSQKHTKYATACPDGYELVWIGDWHGDERIEKFTKGDVS